MSLFRGNIQSDGNIADGNDALVLKETSTIYSQDRKCVWRLLVPEPHALAKCIGPVVLPEGPKHYIVFTAVWFSSYQHILIDHLGYWNYLREHAQEFFPLDAPEETHFIFEGRHVPAHLLDVIDPEFAKRVTFVKQNTLLEAPPGSSLSVFIPPARTTHLDLLEGARRWISNSSGSISTHGTVLSAPEKTIIYYKRISETTNLGRIMDAEQEERILGMIQPCIKRYNRPERLVIFDGKGLVTEQQIALFQSASIVIGPHGGGLANLIFTSLPSYGVETRTSCDQRTKVIEFVTSPETRQLQRGEYQYTYFHFFSTMPWVELHHVFYEKPSTGLTTFIDLAAFNDALHSVMTMGDGVDATDPRVPKAHMKRMIY
jgi:hypothetical protein